jgi:hypothetical protein
MEDGFGQYLVSAYTVLEREKQFCLDVAIF